MFVSILFYVTLALLALYVSWKSHIKPVTIPVAASSPLTPVPTSSPVSIEQSPSIPEIFPLKKPISPQKETKYTIKLTNSRISNPTDDKENTISSGIKNSKQYSTQEEKQRDLELTSFILKETEKSILELKTKHRNPLGSLSSNIVRRPPYNPNVPEFQPKIVLNPNAQDFCPIR